MARIAHDVSLWDDTWQVTLRSRSTVPTVGVVSPSNTAATALLSHFCALAASRPTSVDGESSVQRDPRTERLLEDRVVAVEEQLDRILPEWRRTFSPAEHDPWQQHRQAASRALLLLRANASGSRRAD